MRIGFHSPMPPARTGVADYSAALADALRVAGHDVRVGGEGDVELQHIGNNALHRGIYERALARPGAVILHDAVLQHFYLGFGDEARYVDEFVHNYGEWHRGTAQAMWRNRARSGADPQYFAFPMLRRVAEAARMVIVHNTGAAAMVRAHAPGARVEELPHLFTPPPAAPTLQNALELRHGWGMPANAFLFGVFGYLRESKRLHTVLAAARRLEAAWLLVAGEFVSDDYARAMEPVLKTAPRVIRVAGHLSEAAFWRHAQAVDACINLRYPTAGETSGIAIRLMGLGKPVLLTGGAEASAFPPEACIRIDPGTAEEEMLALSMQALMSNAAAARQLGSRAAAYIQGAHAPESVAAQLTDLLASL
ncbi:MAG: hypothetical protein IT162_18805 [Bryobacterales bacterium]|nr:hypothetical protein [Bryobacterales bacterium]